MFNPFKGAIKEDTAVNNCNSGNLFVLSADVFDESKVDFQLNGGPKYTDVLMATALFNAGKNKGFACPLVCKWFYTFKSSELHTIEGVKSSFYQPSLDDIGARICVHAYPTNGIDEYEGMPMFAEVGPLVMDDEILQLAQDYISKKKPTSNPSNCFESNISIKQSNIDYLKNKSLPISCTLAVNDMMIMLNNKENAQFFAVPYSKSFPKLKAIRNANNLIEILVNESENLIIEISPSLRDMLTLVVRTLWSKCPLVNLASSDDSYYKLPRLPLKDSCNILDSEEFKDEKSNNKKGTNEEIK